MLGRFRQSETAMSPIDHTHDPALKCWVESANGHADFPIQNLPLGVFSPAGGGARLGIAIGDRILDLGGVAALLPGAIAPVLAGDSLNGLMALPSADRVALRRRVSELLNAETHRAAVEPMLPAPAE